MLELQCPHCGGTVDWAETERQKYCSYCGSLLYFEQDRKNYWYIEPRINTLDDLREVLILSKAEKDRADAAGIYGTGQDTKQSEMLDILSVPIAPFVERFRKLIRIQTTRLIYAPYYLLKGILYQSLLGQDRHGSKEFGLHRIPVDEAIPAYADVLWNFRDRGIRFGKAKLKETTQSMLSRADHIAFSENEDATMEKIGRVVPRDTEYVSALFKDNRLCDQKKIPVLRPYWIVVFTGKSADRPESAIVDASFGTVAGYPDSNELQRFLAYREKPLLDLEAPRVEVVPSRCPVCGFDCRWLAHQKIHVCKNCNRALDISSGSVKEVAYSYATDACANPMFLPFWKVQLKLTNSGKSYESLRGYYSLFYPERLLKADRAANSLFIPAFWIPTHRKGDEIHSAIMATAISRNWNWAHGPAVTADQLPSITVSLQTAAESMQSALPAASGIPPGIHKLGALNQMLKQTKIKVVSTSIVFLQFERKDDDVLVGGKRVPLKLLELS